MTEEINLVIWTAVTPVEFHPGTATIVIMLFSPLNLHFFTVKRQSFLFKEVPYVPTIPLKNV